LKKTAVFLRLLLVLWGYSSSASAAMLCGPYADIRALIVNQKEAVAYRGLNKSGKVIVELYLRRPRTGGISYSLLARSANGLTCLIISSFYFPPFRDSFDGD